MRNVERQVDGVMDSDLESLSVAQSERMSVTHTIYSAQGKPQVLSVASEVEVSLNDSASHALANEPLHIVGKGNIPRVVCLDVACLEITEMLLQLVKTFRCTPACIHSRGVTWYCVVPIGGHSWYRRC